MDMDANVDLDLVVNVVMVARVFVAD